MLVGEPDKPALRSLVVVVPGWVVICCVEWYLAQH